MTFTNSTSMIVAAAKRTDANNLFEAMGRGPGNFSIPLWADADDPELDDPVSYGCHTFDDELAGIVASRVLPSGLDLVTYSLTTETATAALNSIAIYSVAFDPENDSAIANFTALSTSLGLRRS